MSSTQFIRHGDRLLRPIEKLGLKDIPSGKSNKSGVIGLGETTGHKHKLSGQTLVYELETPQTYQVDGREVLVDQFVEVLQDTKLQHEEHHTVLVPKGKYALVPEREIDILEQKIRKVSD